MTPTQTFRVRPLGFSLVELMVAMLIGLIGTIVIFQVFAVSEERKRTTTSGGDAQQNGILAIYSIERDARMAGYGINSATLLGCNVVAHDNTATARNFNFTMSPVQITDGSGGAPDTITIVQGNSGLLSSPTQLTIAAPAGTTAYSVGNPYGFNPGDVVIAAEAGVACSLATTNGLAGGGTQVSIGTGSYNNTSGAPTTPRYGTAAGTTVAYDAYDKSTSSGGQLFNFGPAPTVAIYSVANSQLMYQNLMTDSAASPVVDGIVNLQAQYGRDTTGTGTVSTWDLTQPTTALAWSRVLAVRIGVVTRSANPERPSDPLTGVCGTTISAPSWSGGAFVLSTDPDWQCYRYRVFETTIPLRNSIWPQ